MSFDWTKKANENPMAEKIPASASTMLTIDRVVFGKKDGTTFESSKGDPQIMVIFVDDEGREAGQMITLSDKAGWVLARLFARFGGDSDALTARGLRPQDFARPGVCHELLYGLTGTAQVTYEGGPNNDKYAKIEPLENGAGKRKPVRAVVSQEPKSGGYADAPTPTATTAGVPYVGVDEADIPFAPF